MAQKYFEDPSTQLQPGMEDSALQLGDGVTIKERHAGASIDGKPKVMLEDSVLQLKVLDSSA